MKAKEQFEALGYHVFTTSDNVRCYKIESVEDYGQITRQFHFDLDKKVVRASCFCNFDDHMPKGINMHELKAINKMVEELGW